MEAPNQDNVAPPDPTNVASSHPEPPQASPGGAVLSPSRIPKKFQTEAVVDPSSSASIELKLPPPPGLSPPRSNSFDNGLGSLVLPDGVTLPSSVTPDMIDGRLRRSFLELAPTQMREVLDEYHEAVREKGSEIRNKNAYLFGVVKRYKSLHERTFNSNGGYNAMPQGSNLTGQVSTRLDTLIASGFCTAEELDMKIKDRMRMLSERDALDAIDEMNGCSRAEIRNFGSYFMGIMNRYMRGERMNPQNRGSNRARNNNQGGNRFDDRNRNNAGRFSHYGSNAGRHDRDSANSQHGRDDRRDGRDNRSSRDGDRDHYRRRRRSRSRSRSYDSRSRSRSRSPGHRRRRSRSDSRDGYRSRRHDDGRRSSRDSRRSSSHRDSNHSSIQSSKAYVQNPALSHMLRPPPPPPPPPPRPQNMMQPMALGQPQLMGQPHLMGQPQMMLGQPMGGPQFMPTLGQIPQQPAGVVVPNAQQMQQFNPMSPQMQQQQLLQQQLAAALPISNMQQAKPTLQQQPIQQMQNFNQNISQQAATALTNQLLGQGIAPSSLGQGAQANAAWSMQTQNRGQAPMDILGLADKAAQALSGTIPQGGANPNFPPPPAPVPAHSFPQQSAGSEKDLPMMVQYAVQNLRTTGHIEQTLDGNLCGMLKRLPEHAALQALEIFSSCDLSKMRNRSSYLAGILKKELIKLGL
mmetsp:Transcript_15442/g.24210  ORF Transcript_15442/g.24210 Transcript_15442/m.24210 type:complete len:688 (-) Transcript_15442:149-2212(-)